jgi:hypothetical protein
MEISAKTARLLEIFGWQARRGHTGELIAVQGVLTKIRFVDTVEHGFPLKIWVTEDRVEHQSFEAAVVAHAVARRKALIKELAAIEEAI